MLREASTTIPPLDEVKRAIREDRAVLKARLRDAEAAAGAADLARLRQLVRCERAELWRDFGHRNAAEWVSAELQVSNWKARRWLEAARALERLPRIAAALETGSLSLDKTVELTRFATPEREKELIRWARRVSAARIRERGDELARRDQKDIAEAHSSRALWWSWDTDKLRLDVQGYLAGDDAQRFAEAVDSLAKELPDTVAAETGSTQALSAADAETSLDRRRADALVLLATSADAGKSAKPEVVVHAPLSALAKDEGNCCTDKGDVLHPELVRKLSCDARLRFVLTDEVGNALGIGRVSQIAPGWLRRQVFHRDGGRCTFPGCEMRRFLTPHHIKHWIFNGPTDLDNLVTVCSSHHALVHQSGWKVGLEHGRAIWHAPLGQRYEPGRAPPENADPPPEVKPTAAQVAGYSRIFDLLKVI